MNATGMNSTVNDITHCINHPSVETGAKCISCSNYICLSCAVRTPVGYRCRNCNRQIEDIYFNAHSYDNPLAFIVSLAISSTAIGLLTSIFGVIPFFFSICLVVAAASTAGKTVVQVVRWTVGKRRSRHLRHFMLAGLIMGILIGTGSETLLSFGSLDPEMMISHLSDVLVWLFAALVATTAYQTLH